jgi:hypothetical protein
MVDIDDAEALVDGGLVGIGGRAEEIVEVEAGEEMGLVRQVLVQA